MGDIACGERSNGSGDPVKGLCDVRGDPRPASTQSKTQVYKNEAKTEKTQVYMLKKKKKRERLFSGHQQTELENFILQGL